MKTKRILIMAGGTGGHVFPGLALGRYYQEQGYEVHWLGTTHGMEAKLVPAAGITFHAVQIKGLRGTGIKRLMTAPFTVTRALTNCISLMRSIKPECVIGMGGFVSGPGGVASRFLGIPLIIHEQNAIAGLTNKLLAPFARRVLTGFPQTFPKRANVQYVGNPVRAEIERLLPPDKRQRSQDNLHVLVVGGSLGAHFLNKLMPQTLALLPADINISVWHQTGEKHILDVKNDYKSIDCEVKIEPFITDMAAAYQWADVVLCRAGALTIAELCSAGLSAILVPYPHAVDDHQTANAAFMVRADAAYCYQQPVLTAATLSALLTELARTPDKRQKMAMNAYSLRQVQVVKKIFDICEEGSL